MAASCNATVNATCARLAEEAEDEAAHLAAIIALVANIVITPGIFGWPGLAILMRINGRRQARAQQRMPGLATASDDNASDDAVISYTEGLATSYRNTAVTPAYPFGHGLSYSDFHFGKPTAAACSHAAICATLPIANSGAVATATVVQLYVEFPPTAGLPSPLLKGFQKTPLLAPAASTRLSFNLTARDISYYSSGAWVRPNRVTLHFGASSADLRQSLEYQLAAAEPA